MKSMPSRDTIGKCIGECRDRVLEGERERQTLIEDSGKSYDEPAESSPSWTADRNDTPGVFGGRV
jgi:hypothetical protein